MGERFTVLGVRCELFKKPGVSPHPPTPRCWLGISYLSGAVPLCCSHTPEAMRDAFKPHHTLRGQET